MKLLLRRVVVPAEEVTCGCCGRGLPRTAVTELGSTPGVFICRRCAVWAAVRVGRSR